MKIKNLNGSTNKLTYLYIQMQFIMDKVFLLLTSQETKPLILLKYIKVLQFWKISIPLHILLFKIHKDVIFLINFGN